MSTINRRHLLFASLCTVLIVAGLGRIPSAQADVNSSAATASSSARDLAGWWLAIDPLFPTMWDKAGIRAMEELLIVDAKGRAEDRVMQFFAPEAASCADGKNFFCSDAPVVARARLTISGRHLKVVDHVDGKAWVFFPDSKLEALYHRTVVTGTPSWTMSRSVDGRVLTLQWDYSSLTRVLVKVDPDRLRRLRAGLVVGNVSAFKSWRCYLANATAKDETFAAIHTGDAAAPKFLDRYLKAASYVQTLKHAAARPVPDDSDPKQRKLAGVPLKPLMLEQFPDIQIPKTVAERDALRARVKAFDARMRGKPAKFKFPLTDPDFTALRRGSSTDVEAKRLFCLH